MDSGQLWALPIDIERGSQCTHFRPTHNHNKGAGFIWRHCKESFASDQLDISLTIRQGQDHRAIGIKLYQAAIIQPDLLILTRGSAVSLPAALQ